MRSRSAASLELDNIDHPYSRPPPTSHPSLVVPSLAESVHLGGAVYPATAHLAIHEPTILDHANAACRCPNSVLTDGPEGRNRKRRMIKSRPVEITLDAKQKVTGLNIITSLDAADEFGEAAVEIVVWNVQIAAGPRPAEIPADIKSRPIVRRCRSGRWRRFDGHVRGVSRNTHAECNNPRNKFFMHAPDRVGETAKTSSVPNNPTPIFNY